jgi:hypothetical protein
MLVAARLVTSDDGVLEVSHEALARAWPRLRGWLDDDVEGQRVLHHLSAAADAWDTLGRPDSELYRGVRLVRALDWQARTASALTDTEHQFLHAARQAAVSADARRVGARSQLTDDISLSLLLAAAGARLDDSPETRVNLLAALGKRPTLVRSAPPVGGYMDWLSVSPDGRWIAAADDADRMHLYDASTSQLLRSYDGVRPAKDGQGSMIGAFSPDGRQLAVILTGLGSTEPVRLLDPDTMQPTATKLAFPSGKPV